MYRNRWIKIKLNSPTLNKILDGYGLIVALAIDILIVGICFVVVSPGVIEAIAMAALSLVVVLFGVRAWIKGNKVLWAMFAFVAFFFDLSFVLVSTDVQSKSTGPDTELVRLTTKQDEADADVRDLQRQYDEAGKRETMDQIYGQLLIARDVSAAAKIDRDERLRAKENAKPPITADGLFSAIPDAVKPKRWIPLIVFAILFSGLQLTIISAATDAPVARVRRRDAPEVKEDVENWVWSNWAGKNGRIISFESFRKFWDSKGGFDEDMYKKIKQAAIDSGVISPGDEILIEDKAEAQRIIEISLDK